MAKKETNKTAIDTASIAQDIFKRYPEKDEVFITSDGTPFFHEPHAKNHANKNKLRIETVLRTDLDKEPEKTEE
jgi:hypothetical protein